MLQHSRYVNNPICIFIQKYNLTCVVGIHHKTQVSCVHNLPKSGLLTFLALLMTNWMGELDHYCSRSWFGHSSRALILTIVDWSLFKLQRIMKILLYFDEKTSGVTIHRCHLRSIWIDIIKQLQQHLLVTAILVILLLWLLLLLSLWSFSSSSSSTSSSSAAAAALLSLSSSSSSSLLLLLSSLLLSLFLLLFHYHYNYHCCYYHHCYH